LVLIIRGHCNWQKHFVGFQAHCQCSHGRLVSPVYDNDCSAVHFLGVGTWSAPKLLSHSLFNPAISMFPSDTGASNGHMEPPRDRNVHVYLNTISVLPSHRTSATATRITEAILPTAGWQHKYLPQSLHYAYWPYTHR
jgi:hypothetical protein